MSWSCIWSILTIFFKLIMPPIGIDWFKPNRETVINRKLIIYHHCIQDTRNLKWIFEILFHWRTPSDVNSIRTSLLKVLSTKKISQKINGNGKFHSIKYWNNFKVDLLTSSINFTASTTLELLHIYNTALHLLNF